MSEIFVFVWKKNKQKTNTRTSYLLVLAWECFMLLLFSERGQFPYRFPRLLLSDHLLVRDLYGGNLFFQICYILGKNAF